LRLDGNYYGQLLDHWGGGRDLEEKRIRVLHSLSFVDDPTRMLRAVKLEQRLGFNIEPRTMQLLENAKPLLGRVTGERLRSEIDLIIREPQLNQIMNRLVELELLEAIHPSLRWDGWLATRVEKIQRWDLPIEWKLQEPIDENSLVYAIWMVRQKDHERKALYERFHLPLAMIDAIGQVASLPCELTDTLRPSEIVQCLEGMSETALVAVWFIRDDSAQAREALHSYIHTLRHVKPHADGETLRAQGLPPGPAYTQILWRLRQAWLDGEVKDESGEGQLMKALISEVQTDD
jgi:tRNA nucleotidyltransferase (CCA-adding enzyme)